MRRVCCWLLVSLFLIACESTPEKQDFIADERINIAENLEQQGRWFDALIQWQILHTLYPEQQHINQEIERISQQIVERKESLKARYAKVKETGSTKVKRDILFAILALAPNDSDAKEALRKMNWAFAIKSANAKTKTIVRYFEENQKKAQKSIELTNLLAQGEQFTSAGKYKALLQVADKLEKKHPKHEQVNKFRYTAYSRIGKQHQNGGEVEQAIVYFEQAANYASEQDKGTLSKSVLALRQSAADKYFIEGKKLFKHDLAKAIEFFRKASVIYPEHSRARGELAKAERIQKNLMRIKNLKK